MSDRDQQPSRHLSTDLEEALAFRIHRTNRLLRTHLARLLGGIETGLTPEQWFLLARVRHREPVRQVDLVDPALGDPPNVSRLVDALQRRGWVGRTPDPDDRRSWRLVTTEAGAALADTVLDAAVAERPKVFAGFADSDLDLLAGLLDRVDANLRAVLGETR